MRIRFINTVTVERRFNICCFSGMYSSERKTFHPGDELTVEGDWIEPRPLAGGRKPRTGEGVTILMLSEGDEFHPASLIDVPIYAIRQVVTLRSTVIPGVPNVNGDIYSKEILEQAVQKAQPIVQDKSMVVTIDYGTDSMVDLRKIVGVVKRLDLEDTGVVVEMELVQTPALASVKAMRKPLIPTNWNALMYGYGETDEHQVIEFSINHFWLGRAGEEDQASVKRMSAEVDKQLQTLCDAVEDDEHSQKMEDPEGTI